MTKILEARKRLSHWRKDAVSFVRECLKANPDPWQVEVLEEFNKNQRIALKACKGPGKTTILSWLAWNFLSTRPHPKIPATSVSGANLDDNLWPEMAKWQHKSEFLKAAFTWTKTRIYANDHPETWFMAARTWPQSADQNKQAETLAGIHADYLLFILDESSDIPNAVMATAEAGLATGIETKLIQAGNPTNLEGPLYRACTKERHLWYVKEITGDPDDPGRAPRISVQWAREQIEKYGKDNPWVLVNVFGKFPPSSINSLLGVEDINTAMKRAYQEGDLIWSQRRLGIDVARFGDDRTVIFPRQGLVAFKPVEMRNARSHEIAARVALAKSNWESEMEFIDDTGGYGAGVVDSMIQHGLAPHAINFAGKAIDPRFANKRAEMWFNMAEWIRRGGSLPDIPELAQELPAVTYMFHQGKFQIEPKDKIKERLGYSPDFSDALALTFAVPEMPSQLYNGVPLNPHAGKVLSDWDPINGPE